MSAPIRWSQKPGSTSVRAFVLPTSFADLASFPLDIPPAAVTPTDTAPPPSSGPDGTPESTFRDRDIRHAIRDALKATSFFDDVVFGNPAKDNIVIPYGIEARVVVIDEFKQEIKNLWDANEIDDVVVDTHLMITFFAQSDDADRRDSLIELMENVAYNAMIGVSWLGQTMPAFSAFGPSRKPPKFDPPLRGIEKVYTYRYMPGSSFGTAE